MFSNIFQRHHVHGGSQRGDHHPHPQLPPQKDGHSRDAGVGKGQSHHITHNTKHLGTVPRLGSSGCCIGWKFDKRHGNHKDQKLY